MFIKKTGSYLLQQGDVVLSQNTFRLWVFFSGALFLACIGVSFF